MRVWVCCGHEELEALMIRDALVADADNQVARFLMSLLKEDRFQNGIELKPDVLKEHPATKAD